MASRFCMKCGAPREGASAFCVKCGAPFDEPAAGQQEPVAYDPFAPTKQMPAYQRPAQPVYSAAAQPQKKRLSTAAIIGIIAAVVAVIVAALLFFFVIGPNMGLFGGEKNAGSVATTSVSTASSPASSSASSSVTAQGKLTENQYCSTLYWIYDSMSGFDSQVSSCAVDFNSNYLKVDRSLRQGYADTAQTVQSAISAKIGELDALMADNPGYLPAESAHTKELLDDLYNRIHVICAAWQQSLRYDDPSGHQSTIIAPIEADNVNGDNKYYTHFKQYYDAWRFNLPVQ